MSLLNKLGVVILGAGASSRMGRPKLLLPWRDTTVIAHIIGQWRRLGASQIAVVGRPNDADLAAELKRAMKGRGFRHSAAGRRPSSVPGRSADPSIFYVVNPHPDRGMFSSIQCAANWSGWEPEIAAWAIVLGDQPHLLLKTLEALLAFQREHPEAVCQPHFGGHGAHPVLLPRRAFDELKLSQEKIFKNFLKQTSCQSVICSIEDPALSLDIDTPADYIRLHDSLNP